MARGLSDDALELAGIGGWDLAIGTGRLGWTAHMFRLHGLAVGDPPSPEEALRFYRADARPLLSTALARAIAAGTPWELELPLVRADDRTIWVRSCGRAVQTDAGTARLVGTLQDITAWRERRQYEGRLSIIARQSVNAVAILDREELTEWVNDAFIRLTGYTLDELRGRRPVDVLSGPETSEAALRTMHEGIRSGSGYQLEVVQYGRDERLLRLALHCMPLLDDAGNLCGFAVMANDVTSRHEAEALAAREVAERTRAEALLRDMLDTVPDAIVLFDADERLLQWNRGAEIGFATNAGVHLRIGMTPEDVFRTAATSSPSDDKGRSEEEHQAWVERRVAAIRSPRSTQTVRFSDGRRFVLRCRRSPAGNIVAIYSDTTAIHRAQDLLRDILDAIPTAVSAYDADERLILSNAMHDEMLPEMAPVMTPGRTLQEILQFATDRGLVTDVERTPEERAAWVNARLTQHRSFETSGQRITALPNGHFALARSRRSRNGNLVLVRTDVTELKRTEAQLRQRAERDVLTGLANRAAFLATLDQRLQTPGGPGTGGALMLLDLDYLKQINDTLGHDIGDALLTEIARRLQALVRPGDIAARLGGDEFAVLLAGAADRSAWVDRIERMVDALGAPFEMGERNLSVSVSVGVSHFPADGADAPTLLKRADLALYQVKRNGRGRWMAFRPDLAMAQARRASLGEALRDALRVGAIQVALQPTRQLRGGHAGFEALARWHDGQEWVAPAEFIPAAEESGLIIPLGYAVMNAALARARQLHDMGLDPGRIAVNVTGPQLLDPQFRDETLAALRRHRLQPETMILELTETILFGRAAERIEGVLRELSQSGLTLALDDFGTGYASLAHLARLPIDQLKIDRSFVAEIGKSPASEVITRTVIGLARNLGMESVAEGIETKGQLAFLNLAGCDVGQGYLFARPLLTMPETVAYLQGRLTRSLRHGVAALE